MSHRREKMDKHLQRLVGEIMNTQVELPADVLVTVSRVETAPNLKSALVWLYISPLSAAPDVMKYLDPQLPTVQHLVHRELRTQPRPRLRWQVDRGAEHAQQIEQRLSEL